MLVNHSQREMSTRTKVSIPLYGLTRLFLGVTVALPPNALGRAGNERIAVSPPRDQRRSLLGG